MKFKKKVLSNGLTILHEKRDVPVTTIVLAAKHGAAYEKKEEKGMSHFMEHLCFKGTSKRNARQISSEVEKVGGILNAFTDEEHTAYYSKISSNHFETALDVLFDIYFNASFPEEEIKKEASVICEELKMIEDNSSRFVYEKLKEKMYKGPFGFGVSEEKKNVFSISRKKLFEKHRNIYFSKNTILCVVGDVDFLKLESLVKKFLIKKSGKVDSVKKIIRKNGDGLLLRKENNQSNIAIGVHLLGGNKKERYVAEVFNVILGVGMSSRLFLEVREKRGLVYGVHSDLAIGKNFGYLVIRAGTSPSNVKEVISLCKDEFSKMNNVTEEELEEAKLQLVGHRHLISESSELVAFRLIEEEILGDAVNYYSYEKKIKEVSLKDIKKFSKKKDFSSFVIGP